MVVGIIPARYASTRFPGKPLVTIGGRPMVMMVYDRVSEILKTVYVATDDERIAEAVDRLGGRVVMTSAEHRSGTDRCAEALSIIGPGPEGDARVVLNIQGDEPFIRREQVEQLARCFDDPGIEIATLVKRIERDEELKDPNKPKVVMAANGNAMLFSRYPVPYMREPVNGELAAAYNYYRHIGIYGYRADILPELTSLAPSPPEIAESLEQLRWLYNGYSIRCLETPYESPGIDTPEDLERVKKEFKLK